MMTHELAMRTMSGIGGFANVARVVASEISASVIGRKYAGGRPLFQHSAGCMYTVVGCGILGAECDVFDRK